MKKSILAIVAICMLSGCFVFKKKEKYGCPNDARNSSQEEQLAKEKKTKYKGGRKF